MSLINEYRPKHWGDVAGHSVEIKRLQGIIKREKEKKVPNALFFAGPSGLGKTTLARMFANYLNCEKHTYCGECKPCKSKGTDILEIDGASNNKIDDMRSLMETLRFKPQAGKYRFVIIDEIQQLTTQAEQCFPAGTLVQTVSKETPIEEMKVGDLVVSYNHEKNCLELKTVEAVKEKTTTEEMLRIYVSETDFIECTENHQIWSVTRQSYVKAKDIQDGEELALM